MMADAAPTVVDAPSIASSEQVVVRIAAQPDEPSWSRYVAHSQRATVFHDWRWRSILENAFGHRPHYLTAWRGSQLVGVLPLAEVRSRLFGRQLVSLPFCSWAGPLFDDASVGLLLDAFATQLARTLEVDHLSYRTLEAVRPDWPTQDLYVMFSKEISADDEVNLKAIPRKQRAVVRKGIQNGLHAELDRVETLYDLYCDNVHRHGTPGVPRSFFDAMVSQFGDQCEILVVRTPQGIAVSGVLSLYFRDEVFPFYAGDTPDARRFAANDFKYWEVMRRAVARGSRRFNYGRSKRGSGSFDFKKNWGFEPRPLHYAYWLNGGVSLPQHNPANPKYRAMINTWRRLPRSVVDWLGPRIVGGLG